MYLILFRHGPPLESLAWMQQGKEESQRPLTEDGRDVTRKASGGLKKILTLQQDLSDSCLICSSPYTRALQTADILKNILEISQDIDVLEQLTPQSHPREFSSFIFSYSKPLLIAVGHEPHLSRLGEYLLFQEENVSFLRIQRAGALCIQLNKDEDIRQLLWLMTPQQLASIYVDVS